MKVTVSTISRFHAFNLVQQLQQQGHLDKFISTYPTFAVTKYCNYNIDPTLYCSIWWLGLLHQTWTKLPTPLRRYGNSRLWLAEKFDKAVRDRLSPESDLFIGWSSLCLYSLQRGKELGIVTIVDCGSSHVQYQWQVLQEEYELWGLKFDAIHPGVYERELQEYDRADMIAIPSSFVKRTFLAQGVPEHKLIHVPYGVSLAEFYPVPRQDNKFRVIHCGGITLRKGYSIYFKLFTN